MSGIENLIRLLEKADLTDRIEALQAYPRYNATLVEFADFYGFDFQRTVAAFVALSPNNGYFENLRSLASVMQGLRDGIPPDRIVVSTYKHCRDRALRYLSGDLDFLTHVKGLKTKSFYTNIVWPKDPDWVTVDGHVYAAWRGEELTMKDAKLGVVEYRKVRDDVMVIARVMGLVPNQVQAMVWFTRKRVLNIKYQPQMSLFSAPDDRWNTLVLPDECPPFAALSAQ